MPPTKLDVAVVLSRQYETINRPAIDMGPSLYWLLFAIFAILFILGIASAPRDQTGARPGVSAYTLILALFGVYGLLPQLLLASRSFTYLWVPGFSGQRQSVPEVFLWTFALSIFLLAHHYFWFLQGKRRRAYRSKTFESRKLASDALYLALALAAAGILVKIYLIAAGGGVNGSALALSGSTRAAADITTGQSGIGLRAMASVGDFGGDWLLLQWMRGRTSLLIAASAWVINISLTFFTAGKRLSIVISLLIVLVGVSKFRARISVRAAPLLGLAGVGLGMATLLFRILIPAKVAGVAVSPLDVPYADGSVLKFYFYSLEFASTEMLTYVWHNSAVVAQEFGSRISAFYQTSIQPFSFGVPHQVWPGKPTNFVDISYGVSSAISGTTLDNSQVGYIVTYVGVAFIYASLAGVILYSLLLGWLTSRVDQAGYKRAGSAHAVVKYAVMLDVLFQIFRQGTFAWVFINVFVEQTGFFFAWATIAIFARGSSQSAPSGANRARTKVHVR